MVFDYKNASRAELIGYLTTEHLRPIESIIDHTDDELRVLASIGNDVSGETKWYHYAPFMIGLSAIILLLQGEFIPALVSFIIAFISLVILFIVDKNKKMKEYSHLRSSSNQNHYGF